MLVMDVRGLAGSERAYARFWNHLHSIESALSGVKLGLWLRSGDAVPPEPGNAVEFGWLASGDQFQVEQRSLEALTRLDWQAVEAVALARFELPQWVHDLLRDRKGYSATIDGQLDGWWTDEKQVPASRPSSALLPESGQPVDGRDALILVDIDDWWGVLSPRGLGTYTFGARLEAGESIPFLDKYSRRWETRRIADVGPDELRARWPEAAERARPGLPAVRVTMSSMH